MIKKCIFIFLVACTAYIFWQNKAQHPIISINSLEEANIILENCSAHTLILFDINDTLISSSIPLARGHITTKFFLKTLWRFPKLLWRLNREKYISLIWQQAPRFVMEETSPNIIENLKNKGYVVCALTSIETGAYGEIPDFPLFYAQLLESLGLCFTRTIPDVVFTNLPLKRESYPVFYQGILCTNTCSKGQVLEAFLDYLQEKNIEIDTIVFSTIQYLI